MKPICLWRLHEPLTVAVPNLNPNAIWNIGLNGKLLNPPRDLFGRSQLGIPGLNRVEWPIAGNDDDVRILCSLDVVRRGKVRQFVGHDNIAVPVPAEAILPDRGKYSSAFKVGHIERFRVWERQQCGVHVGAARTPVRRVIPVNDQFAFRIDRISPGRQEHR